MPKIVTILDNAFNNTKLSIFDFEYLSIIGI